MAFENTIPSVHSSLPIHASSFLVIPYGLGNLFLIFLLFLSIFFPLAAFACSVFSVLQSRSLREPDYLFGQDNYQHSDSQEESRSPPHQSPN